MELAFYLISEIYAVLIIGFIFGFIRLKAFKLKNTTPENKFSVLIPFRNEAKNLPNLLASISKLTYPKNLFEIILINDFSSDNSVEIIEKFKSEHPDIQITIVQNQESSAPKKTAIELGIKKAKFDWIVTTDADCKIPSKWLHTYDQKITSTHPRMICGPVKLTGSNKFSSIFEILNFNSLQGATMGSFGWKHPILCNGANLCYHKQAFYEVNGFSGNDTIASGDDIFLLEKLRKKHPKSIHFLKSKEAIVETSTQPTFKDFIAQQQRWTAKSKSYKSVFTKMVGFIVFTENLSLIVLLLLASNGESSWEVLYNCLAIKMIVDTVLIYQSLRFYKQEKLAIASFPMSIVYPFFSVAMVVLSLFSNYQWKGRSFKS